MTTSVELQNKKRKKKRCRFFHTAKGCSAGENCRFVHEPSTNKAGGGAEPQQPAPRKSKKKCRYGSDCNDIRCTFLHPEEEEKAVNETQQVVPPSTTTARAKIEATLKKKKVKKWKCKFGSACHKPNCKFAHPSATLPATAASNVRSTAAEEKDFEHLAQDLLHSLSTSSTQDPQDALHLASELLHLMSNSNRQGANVHHTNHVANLVSPSSSLSSKENLDNQDLARELLRSLHSNSSDPMSRSSLQPQEYLLGSSPSSLDIPIQHLGQDLLHQLDFTEEVNSVPAKQGKRLSFKQKDQQLQAEKKRVELEAKRKQLELQQAAEKHRQQLELQQAAEKQRQEQEARKAAEKQRQEQEARKAAEKQRQAEEARLQRERADKQRLAEEEERLKAQEEVKKQQQQVEQAKLERKRAKAKRKEEARKKKEQEELEAKEAERMERERHQEEMRMQEEAKRAAAESEKQKLAKMREEVRRQQAAARERKKQEKSKKQERRIQELELEFKQREEMWTEELRSEKEYVSLMVDLCASEFVRQNKNTAIAKAANLSVEQVKEDKDAMEKLRDCCKVAYRELFRSQIKSHIVVAGLDKDMNGRTGVIQFWDEGKQSFSVGLDTKKGNVDVRYLKPGNLDVDPHPKTKSKKAKAIDRFVLEADGLFLNLSLDFVVTASVVDAVKAAPNKEQFLQSLMDKRDALELQRKMEEEEERKREEEDRRRRAEKKAQENAEWERRKEEMKREKEEYEEFMKDVRRERRESQSYEHGYFTMGGGCSCPRCQFERRFRGHAGFSFFEDFFFASGVFDDEDEDDYFDFDERWSRREAEEREEENQKHAEVLGVPVDASPQMIKSVYRSKALRFHPDKFREDNASGLTKEESTEQFKMIQNAYDHLMSNFDD